MIAEIYNKISRTGSNLSDRLEDKLTGDVFGAIRYLPFGLGMKTVVRGVRFLDPSARAGFDLLMDRIVCFDYTLDFKLHESRMEATEWQSQLNNH